ncbi:MAG: dockerin type I repeat-containing protein [Ruminococcus sp.]|nr:dockerin type I repeat-containing protein [Ruminococcus sp.]
MKKLLSLILVLTFALTGVSLLGVGAEGTYSQPEKFIYGDVDLDGDVTVKDATLIQKGLAKITYVTAVQRCLADPEGTGYSIKNATAIQKYLAKYETATPWGTELIMASQDEFLNADSDNYYGERISVNPLPNFELSYEYTLEDFPEYNFSNIERKTLNKGQVVYYNLYLAEPSKENALEAVKALDYRTNIDLDCVELCYYFPAS